MKIKIPVPLITIIGLCMFAAVRFYPLDDSDKSWHERSGMSIRVDAKTGVNYLSRGFFGGLVVRVDTNGLPVVTEIGAR